MSTRVRRERNQVCAPYRSQILRGHVFALLVFGAIAVSIWAMRATPNAKAEISIQYNVGEIIAAILAGGGAAAPGLAYAARTLRSPGEE